MPELSDLNLKGLAGNAIHLPLLMKLMAYVLGTCLKKKESLLIETIGSGSDSDLAGADDASSSAAAKAYGSGQDGTSDVARAMPWKRFRSGILHAADGVEVEDMSRAASPVVGGNSTGEGESEGEGEEVDAPVS